MRYLHHMGLALVAMAALGLVVGCGSKPPEDVQKATVSEAKPVERAPRAEAQAEETESAAEMVEEAAEAVAGVVEEAAETVAEAMGLAPENVYTIEANDHSEISWVGYGGVLGNMEGGFALFDGTVALRGEDIESAEIDVTIDMTTIYSGARALTQKLAGDEFFHTGDYPEAVFQSTGIEKTDAGYNVSGNLQIMDKNLNINFPAQISLGEKGLETEAEFTIDRRAWGINYDGTGDNFIKDEVLLRFKLLATPAA